MKFIKNKKVTLANECNNTGGKVVAEMIGELGNQIEIKFIEHNNEFIIGGKFVISKNNSCWIYLNNTIKRLDK